MKVLRDGQVLDLHYQVQARRPLVPVLHGVDCVPSYFIVGGLVFVPLSIPFLEHAYGGEACQHRVHLSLHSLPWLLHRHGHLLGPPGCSCPGACQQAMASISLVPSWPCCSFMVVTVTQPLQRH